MNRRLVWRVRLVRLAFHQQCVLIVQPTLIKMKSVRPFVKIVMLAPRLPWVPFQLTRVNAALDTVRVIIHNLHRV